MITDTKRSDMSSDGFTWKEALLLITHVYTDPRTHRPSVLGQFLAQTRQHIRSESTAAVRNCYSPITVAKTVKLRAELCRAAVCFPSLGM